MSVHLSGTGMHCDHTVHFSADLSLWLDSPIFWAPWHQSMSTYSQPSFSSSTWKMDVWMCKLDVICQEQLKIEIKLLLSANGKSYMPRRLAQKQITLSDPEWAFHIVYNKINIIRVARYLCGSWAFCWLHYIGQCQQAVERLSHVYVEVMYTRQSVLHYVDTLTTGDDFDGCGQWVSQRVQSTILLTRNWYKKCEHHLVHNKWLNLPHSPMLPSLMTGKRYSRIIRNIARILCHSWASCLITRWPLRLLLSCHFKNLVTNTAYILA